MFGVDATRVYCTSGPRAHHRIVALHSNGSLTKLRDLPARAVPHRGTKKTIVGVIRERGIFVNAVFSPTGKLIGTVCVANQVIAQRDDTHLIAVQTGADQVSSTILEVAAPTR